MSHDPAAMAAELKRLEAELERKKLEEQVARLQAELAQTKQSPIYEEYTEEFVEDEYYEEEIIEEEIIEEEIIEDSPGKAPPAAGKAGPAKKGLGRWFGRGAKAKDNSAAAPNSPMGSASQGLISSSSELALKPAAASTTSPIPTKGSLAFSGPQPPLVALPFKPRDIPLDPPSPPGQETVIEKLLGPHLYVGGKLVKRSTLAAVKGQELLLLYFGSKFNRESKEFFPLLKDFYCTCAQANKIECVYISHDRSLMEFKDIFARMPWPAMTTGTSALKNHMAKELKIIDVPALVVLDIKSGLVITTHAVDDVTPLQRNNLEQANALVAVWRKIVPIPFEEVVMDARLKHGTMERHPLYWE